MPGLYLKTLHLQNFATFNDETVSFVSSFNSIVGETGSGKSLLLDALGLIFGLRADKEMIRSGSDFSLVEALFFCSDKSVLNWFCENGYPFSNNEIVIKRIIDSGSKSKIYINHQMATLQILQSFSKRFVDLVGQFENQKLLSADYQLLLLDRFAKNEPDLADYKRNYAELKDLKDRLYKLEITIQTSNSRKDYLNYQLEFLQELSPSLEDEQTLLKRKDEFISAKKNRESYQEINRLLSEDEQSNIIQSIGKVAKKLEFINYNSEKISKVYEALSLFEELSYEINNRLENNESEHQLDSVIDRLDRYQQAKRKFNVDSTGLLKIFNDFLIEQSNLTTIDVDVAALKKEILTKENLVKKMALALHEKRQATVAIMSELMTKHLRQLNMKNAIIDLSLHMKDSFDSSGISELDFLVQTNAGEGFHQVKKVASGGELSRILLALRQIISSNDTISIFLFDEIDTGLDGQTAITIGQALAKISQTSQVIAITHMAQLANSSSQIVKVNKKTEGKGDNRRTYSNIQLYKDDQKQDIIQEMIKIQ